MGFVTERMSYTTMSLFPPVWALRRLRALKPTSVDEAESDFSLKLPRPVEWLADLVTRTELAVEKRVDLPFGVSLFGAMRKPAGG